MFVRHGLRLLVGGALLAAFSAGCEDSNQSFIILGSVIGVPQQTGGCNFQVDSDVLVRASGIVDVSLRRSYRAPLAVENQLIVRRDELNARAESNFGVFTSADVRTIDGAGAVVGNFTTPVTQTPVPPGVQRGVVFSDMIDPNLLNRLASQLKLRETRDFVTYVKLHGRTSGNKAIETDEFQFLMQVCNGCLVTFPPASVDASIAKPNCRSSENPDNEAPCSIGADDPVDCRFCRGLSSCDPCTYSSDPACKNP
ncbi:MAG: hypothetical protein U0174_17020 [Polyangiaceae bacterium]